MINVKALRRLAKYVYIKHSPTYYRTMRFLRVSESLSEESLQAWQFRQLRKILTHVYEKVPYYRETFKQAGLDPRDMANLGDMLNFPLVSKEQYRDNVSKFIAEDVTKAALIRVYTGGTTGTPIPLYRSPSDFAREKAFEDYAFWMLEMDPFCKSVYMRGEVDDKRGRYHYVGNFGRTLYLSSHNMGDMNLELYVKLIRDFRPRLLYALPSVATVLAGYMDRMGMPPFDGLCWAFCPSENLYNFQTKLLERVFECRVGTFYGHAEHAVLATCCTKSRLYHVLPQYGYAELIDGNGDPVAEEGKSGEIVCTAFTNSCCPLIRYRTGDHAIYATKKCRCGRSYQTWKRIEGRGQALAVAKNRGLVPIGPDLLCTIHDKTYGKIRQFGIEQRHVGELTVKVVPYEYSAMSEIREYFKRVFVDQFPGNFDVKVDQVEKLTLSKSEKHLYFIQRIEAKTLPVTHDPFQLRVRPKTTGSSLNDAHSQNPVC